MAAILNKCKPWNDLLFQDKCIHSGFGYLVYLPDDLYIYQYLKKRYYRSEWKSNSALWTYFIKEFLSTTWVQIIQAIFLVLIMAIIWFLQMLTQKFCHK